jgi:D-sedoheptulose 7-phosphate isomerase
MSEVLKEYIRESNNAYRAIEFQIKELLDVVELIWLRIEKGGVIYWMGNGGSAGDSQHLACELISRFQVKRKPIRSVALTTNTSLITAIANDYHFNNIFERQVEALVNENDVIIGISTSGESKNVIIAQELAKKIGALTIAFTGSRDSSLDRASDFSIKAASEVTGVIQQCHILYGQAICYLLEEKIST